MRRLLLVAFSVAVATGCGSPSRGADDDDDTSADACVGLECRIDDCASRGMPDTTITGTAFAPNGTLALFGVNVYIPASDPGPLPDGVQCSQCQSAIPGGSVGAVVQSGTDGKFVLTHVPSGLNVPIVLQVGKWRRKLDIPMVNACAENALPATLTSLPKNHTQGDMPKIAMTSGFCDSLECLLRKIGIDQSEFTTDAGMGRVNLYNGGGFSALADGTQLPTAASLWNDLNKLKQYDIALFSCNCDEDRDVITPQMMANVKAFADVGGRMFLSHYHEQWIAGVHVEDFDNPHTVVMTPQQEWPKVATCNVDTTPINSSGVIDTANNPKGNAFAAWMLSVMGSTTLGQFPITSQRKSCTMVDNTKAERWVYLQQDMTPQDFQFTTPLEQPKDNRCGKVVFSDMHVSGTGTSGSFPSSCTAGALTPQEKALAFMFFDIASCVGPIL